MSLAGFYLGMKGRIDTLKGSFDTHAAATTGIHGAVSANTANRLIIRDANGRAQVSDPPVADNSQLIATTAWVLANGGSGSMSSVTQGTGITCSPNPITASGTISLANTAVTPGTYSFATVTVDAQGRITSASAGTPVLTVSAAGPVLSSGGQNPFISMPAATASNAGYMTLAYASKLDGIAAGAQVNTVSSVHGRTGAVVAVGGDYNISHISGVIISGSAPSGGSDGNIWFRHA